MQQAGEVDERAAAQELVRQQAVDRAVDENADRRPRASPGRSASPGRWSWPWSCPFAGTNRIRFKGCSHGTSAISAGSGRHPSERASNVGPWGRVSIGCHIGVFHRARRAPLSAATKTPTMRARNVRSVRGWPVMRGRRFMVLLWRRAGRRPRDVAGRLLRAWHDRAAAAGRQPAALGACAPEEPQDHRRYREVAGDAGSVAGAAGASARAGGLDALRAEPGARPLAGSMRCSSTATAWFTIASPLKSTNAGARPMRRCRPMSSRRRRAAAAQTLRGRR